MADLTLIAPPRISRGQFARILSAAGSPAAPEAAPCYDAIIGYGIDPAVALAFFEHESSYGTKGSAVRTRNWGNIRIPTRRPPWGMPLNPTQRGSLAIYATWRDSLAAWCDLIAAVYVPSGRDTVARAIPSYAPAGPPDYNQPGRYIAAVEAAVAAWVAEDAPPAAPNARALHAWCRVRARPRVDAPVIGHLVEGQAVVVDHIIADGATVIDAGGVASTRWARITAPHNGYVAAYLLEVEP